MIIVSAFYMNFIIIIKLEMLLYYYYFFLFFIIHHHRHRQIKILQGNLQFQHWQA